VIAIAFGIVGVAFFAGQVSVRQEDVLAGYEESGAATFVVRLSGVPDDEVVALTSNLRALKGVQSVEAPYNGIELGLVADTSFLVFQNDRQKEYLGARLNVLGIDSGFRMGSSYFINFRDLNPQAAQSVLGIPLLPVEGEVRPPTTDEVLVPSSVASYVGIRPGAEAIVELTYTGVEPPIVQRLDRLRVVGVFDAAGPDKGQIIPFWRLLAQGQEVLTVRPPGESGLTTIPVVLNAEVVRSFLSDVQSELRARGLGAAPNLAHRQIVIQAGSIAGVPALQGEVDSLLRARSLTAGCDAQAHPSFCMLLPERNNFAAAIREQAKVSQGGDFFLALLLVLVAVGAGGLQVQSTVTRWRDYGVLQAIGFSPVQILFIYASQLLLILGSAVALAAIATLVPSPLAGSTESFLRATGLAVLCAMLASLPALLWPLFARPVVMLQEVR